MFERATSDYIVALRTINDEMREEEQIHAAAQHDFRFHSTLVGILANKQVTEIYRIMKPVMLKIMESGVNRMTTHGISFDAHGGSADALETRNRFAYQYRMSQHLEAGLALFKE